MGIVLSATYDTFSSDLLQSAQPSTELLCLWKPAIGVLIAIPFGPVLGEGLFILSTVWYIHSVHTGVGCQ